MSSPLLPFTHEDFIAAFADYNNAIWPIQVAALALGIGATALVFVHRPWAARVVTASLASMWLWTGFAYHWLYFAAINPAAIAFGVLFVVEGGLLLHLAVFRQAPRYRAAWNASTLLGLGLVAYALALYPLIGLASGQHYPGLPIFGVTPCPVTLFTIGILLLTRESLNWTLFVVPLLWSLIGGTAAFLLGVPQDWSLLAGGAIVLALLFRRCAEAKS